MKKVLALVMAAAMTLSLAACGGASASGTASGSASGAAVSATVPTSSGEAVDIKAASLDTTGTEPQYGGEVNLYYPKFYNYFDPAMMDEYQFSFWYETLWVMDWGMDNTAHYQFDVGEVPIDDLTGQIATDDAPVLEADASGNGTLTVKIRDDVHFQDGDPYNGRLLTADDVVYSYSRLLGLNGVDKVDTEYDWASTLKMIKGIEAPDDTTVVFTFTDGMANEIQEQALMNAKVNIAGKEWDELTDDQKSDWHYAKGTGPYILTDYEEDNSMTLAKNDNYYDYDERYPDNKLPYIDTIHLIYISDASNILAQAMSGELDWFGENGKEVLSRDQLSQLQDADAGGIYEYDSSSPAAIALKVCQEPFNNIKVRQAMQHAIDLDAANVFLGNSGDVIVPGLWATGMSWSTYGDWPQSLTDEFAYDPQQAKELLEEAGYPDGFEFDIELDPTANLQLYQLAASELAQVGITMNITVASEMMEAVQHSQDYDDTRQSAGFGGGYGSYDLAFMMTGNGQMPNAYGHDDQDYLDMLDQMGSASTVEEQTEIAKKLDQYFPAQHWAILVEGVQPTYDFMSKRIGGYSGEKVYYKGNMRTIWARLWVEQ